MAATLDTQGHCFLCYKAKPNRYLYEELFNKISLQSVCRFLKIDLGHSVLPDETSSETGSPKRDVCAVFCKGCTDVINSCVNLIRELQVIQLRLADKLGTVSRILELGAKYQSEDSNNDYENSSVTKVKEILRQKCLNTSNFFTMPQVPLIQLQKHQDYESFVQKLEPEIVVQESQDEVPVFPSTYTAHNSTDVVSIAKFLQDKHMTLKSSGRSHCTICKNSYAPISLRCRLHFLDSHPDMVFSFIRDPNTTDEEAFREICLQVLHQEKVKASQSSAYCCIYCSDPFADHRTLVYHVTANHFSEIRPNIERLQADILQLQWRCWEVGCEKSFATRGQRRRHLEWEHCSETKCKYCQLDCASSTKLRRHTASGHPEQLFMERKLEGQTLLEFRNVIESFFKAETGQAARGVGKDKVFMCCICQITYRDVTDYKKHLVYSHTEYVEQNLTAKPKTENL